MSKLRQQQLAEIATLCNQITTAHAGKNPDVHKDDCSKLVDLYDDLDRLASAESIRAMALEILHLRRFVSQRVWNVDPVNLNAALAAKPEGMSMAEWFNQQYAIKPAAVDDALVIMEDKTK